MSSNNFCRRIKSTEHNSVNNKSHLVVCRLKRELVVDHGRLFQ